MRKIIKGQLWLVSFLLFLTFACNKDVKPEPESEEPCFKKIEKEMAVEAILKTEEFQEILQPETKDRLPVKLLKSYFIRPDLKIRSNGHQVLFNDTLHSKNTYEIRIIEVDCQLKTAKYSIWTSMERTLIKGIVQKADSSWNSRVATKRKILSKLDRWEKMKIDKLNN